MTGAAPRSPWPLVVAGLVLVPVLLDLGLSGRERVFGYLAADAFYYFTVAQNVADHGVVSFDQTHPTNGFHPLWQGAVAAISWLVPNATVFLYTIIVLSASVVALTFHRLARTWERVIARASPVVLLLPVGPYALAVLPWWARREPAAGNLLEGPFPLFGTSWSWINGMETGIALLFFALVVERIALPRPGRDRGIAFGALLGGMVLSRLDLALFVPGLLLAWGLRRRVRGEGTRPGIAAAGVVAAVVGAYVVLNRIFFGSFLPVSAAAKSKFPEIRQNSLDGLGDALGNFANVQFDVVVRYGQILIPAAVAVGWLIARLFRAGRATPGWTAALDGCSVGVIVLAAYDLLFVGLLHQWHWYFPASIVFVSLVALVPLEVVRVKWRIPSGVVAGALAVLCVGAFLTTHRRLDYHRMYADFYYEAAPGVRDHYGDAPPHLVSMDDGIVAWATGFPTMAGRGLMLDAEAARAQREGSFLDLCRERGFDRVTALVYTSNQVPRKAMSDSSLVARRYGKFALRRMSPEGLEFFVDYHSPDPPFLIVGMRQSGR